MDARREDSRGPECPSREQILEFVAGHLSPELTEKLAGHLESCADCQAKLAELDESEPGSIDRLLKTGGPLPFIEESNFQRAIERVEQTSAPVEGLTLSGEVFPVPPVSTEAMAAPSVPTQAGDYELLDQLGEGAMGAVYRGRHRQLGTAVAVKLLHPDRKADESVVRRFRREMEAVGQLDHPNIVRATDAGEESGVQYLVMEYVDGTDLAKLCTQNALDVSTACELVRQAAIGLDYAHRNGCIHRDVKPSNLMLGSDGTVKLLDLGLARLADDLKQEPEGPHDLRSASSGSTGNLDISETKHVMGTLGYMAPEQASDSHAVDARADVYSLGCTLYKLLAGSPSFGDAKYATSASQILAHAQQPVPPVTERNVDVPEELQTILERMLAKDPADRFGTAAEVAEALEPFAVGCDLARLASRAFAESAARKGDATPMTVAPGGKKPRYVPWVVAAVATALLAVTIYVSIVFLMNTPGGTLVVNVNQPNAQVSVDDDKVTLAVPEGGESVEIEVAEGEHRLKITKDGFRPHTEVFAIKSRDRAVFHVTLVPLPKTAVAPFDAITARKHQQAWADHLGQPVEREIDLSGGEKLTMVLIPPGEFLMGSSEEEQARFLEEAQAADSRWAVKRIENEGKQHLVRITQPFALSRTEVTRGQFRQFVKETAYKTEAERDGDDVFGLVNGTDVQNSPIPWIGDRRSVQTDDHPIVNVSWNDAMAFCEWLRKKLGVECTLPSQAQWEYACRAGTTTPWHFGDAQALLREYEWYNTNAGGRAHPAGQLKPNPWGLYDTHGSVSEWFADWYAVEYYSQSPQDDPTGPTTGSQRAFSGGSWYGPALGTRSAFRLSRPPSYRERSLGFRVASRLSSRESPEDPNVPPVPHETEAPAANEEPIPRPDAAVWKTLLPADAPSSALAPFDAATAKEHQQAWAEYLGLEVERELDQGEGEKLTMVLIPPGEFLMGSSEAEQARFLKDAKSRTYQWSMDRIQIEGPRHWVRITQPFALGRHEITRGQFRQFVEETGYKTEAERDGKGGKGFLDGKWGQDPRFVWNADPGFPQTDDHPVLNVSWADADAFCRWLSEKEGVKFDLPTEAQWEYVCRAGTTTYWHCGDNNRNLQKHAWFVPNAPRGARPVGRLEPNAWGLYDMLGNAYEWCADWYGEDFYASASVNDPVGRSTGQSRVIRGGGWASQAWRCRSAGRIDWMPQLRDDHVGFRVASVLAKGMARAEQPKEPGNYALSFDGRNDFVTIPSLRYDGSHPITVEAIVTPISQNSGNRPGIPHMASHWSSVVADSGGAGIDLQVAPHAFKFAIEGPGEAGPRWVVAETPESPFRCWQIHLAGSYDGQCVRLYINGRLRSEKVAPEDSFQPSPYPFMIGANPVSGGRPSGAFRGIIDEVRISKSVRYVEEFEPPERLEPDDDTLSLYHFDEGAGDIARDASENGHDGRVRGATWVKVDALRKGPAAAEPWDPPKATSQHDAINLLTLIESDRDSWVGNFLNNQDALVSPSGARRCLMLPFAPPDEYDLVVTARRLLFNGAVDLGIVVGGRQCQVSIDANSGDGHSSGLEMLLGEGNASPGDGYLSGLEIFDGKGLEQLPDAHRGQILPYEKSVTILCQIRKRGESEWGVRVVCDDRKIYDWQGDPMRLSVPEDNLPPDDRILFLVTKSMFHIEKMELRPISSEGRRIFTADPTTPDRRAAERVLWKGGEVVISVDGQPSLEVSKAIDLPESFRLTGISLDRITRFSGDDLVCLAGLEGLKSLAISDSAMLSSPDGALLDALGGLEELEVHGTVIAENDLTCLADLPHLKRFVLRGAHAGRSLAVLESCPQLLHLDLAGTRLRDDPHPPQAKPVQAEDSGPGRAPISDDELADFLDSPPLPTIDPQETPVSEAAWTLRGVPSLETLNLAGTGVSIEQLAGLSGLKSLRRLDLTAAAVDDSVMESIAQCDVLEELNLAHTPVTDEGLRNLGQMPRLRELNLSYTALTDVSIDTVVVMGELQTLNLAGTEITRPELERLAGQSQLVELDLQNTRIGDSSTVDLKDLKGLKRLTLSYNSQITDDAIEHLAQLTTLESLDLFQTGFSSDGFERLASSLPECRISGKPAPSFADGDGEFGGVVFEDRNNDGIRGPDEPSLAGWSLQLERPAVDEPLLTIRNPHPAKPRYNKTENFGMGLHGLDSTIFISNANDTQEPNGAVFFYDALTGKLQKTLKSPVSTRPDLGFFGAATAIAGDTLAVSDTGEPHYHVGVVHLFDARSGEFLRSIASPSPYESEFFGQSLAVIAGNLLVGESSHWKPADSPTHAYLFEISTGMLLRTFKNPSPKMGDGFGSPIAVVGNKVLIGAIRDRTGPMGPGTAYLFDARTGECLQRFHNPSADESFLSSVAAIGDTVLIGAPKANTAAAEKGGTVYAFDGQTGDLLRTYSSANPTVNGGFGWEIVTCGTNFLVGAMNDRTSDPGAGAVHLVDSKNGALLASYRNPHPDIGGFGRRIRIVAGRIVVGAPLDGRGGTVYVFEALAKQTAAVTDADGNYRFSGLFPGTYSVRVVPPSQQIPSDVVTRSFVIEKDGLAPTIDIPVPTERSEVVPGN